MRDGTSATVRPLRTSDIPAAFQLSTDAGWNQTAEDWRRLISLSPEGCMAIDVGGELAATATLMCYRRKLGWIGMVLTKRQHRGRGFARRLLTEVLDLADRMNIATVKLDATDEGKPIYEKLGFRAEQAVERWSRPRPTETSTLASNTLGNAPLTEELRNADCRAFGADRNRVLDNLAHENTLMAIETSYLLARPGRQSVYLGPCVSDSPRTARSLLERALLPSASSWALDLLPGNTSAAQIAGDLGFTPSRHLLRMVRGPDLYSKTEHIYAIAGFELG